MFPNRLPSFRFGLKTVLVLILGVSIGYSLNLETLKLLTGRMLYSSSLPPYVVAPPDVLRIEVHDKSHSALPIAAMDQYLVGPDGRVNLGSLGAVYVAGKTIDETRVAIQKVASQSIESPEVFVDVVSYNSKTYYIVQDNGKTESISVQPITGNETVLDAIATVGGLNVSTSAKMYIARLPKMSGGSPAMISIDWIKIARGESDSTNHQLLPGDRLYICDPSSPLQTHSPSLSVPREYSLGKSS
jgi:protein involved in polysaccharide export with SLBB domain